ncbi:DNRLRE domain-containing protein [Clostridiaceae bacterium M8S5]|nr:DNRLRE domain-containing protein [Clostridiaceae bacterium M8S5]
MRKILSTILLGFIAFNLFTYSFGTSNESSSTDNDNRSIIEKAIYTHMYNLRYDTIKQYCKTYYATDVTNEQIDSAILNLAKKNDNTKISGGSFLLTYAQLDMRFNQMLWPATHNSFANDFDGEKVVSNYLSKEETGDLNLNIDGAGNNVCTENHRISIEDQIKRGIRCIDIDLGPRMNLGDTIADGIKSLIENAFEKGWQGFKSLFGKAKKPTWDWTDVLGNIDADWSIIECYHRIGFMGRTSINKISNDIKDFLDDNPNEIMVVRVSDLYDGAFGNLDTNDDKFYHLIDKYLENLNEHGLLSQVANYYGDDSTATDKRHEYMFYPGDNFNGKSMQEWPMLKDMILQNKRLVIVLPTYNKIKGDSRTNVKNTDNGSFTDPPGGSEKPYKFSAERININDDQIKSLNEAPHRLLKIDPISDEGVKAGSLEAGKQNNNGRRIYDMVNDYNKILAYKGVNRVVNFVGLDYFFGDKHKDGNRSVDVVDAANRINYENSGLSWNTVTEVDGKSYFNYLSKSKNLGINKYIINAKSDIPDTHPLKFIDKNVWTGTESQNIQGKHVSIIFSKDVMIDGVKLNFFSYEDTVPFEVKITKDGVESSVGVFEIKQDRLSDWYHIPLNGSYQGNKVTLYFKGDRGIHLKEVGFSGSQVKSLVNTDNLVPIDDTFVKWGDKKKYNYHSDQYNINNLEMYSGKTGKSTFMKFDMEPYKSPDKELQKAYLRFKVSDVGSKIDIHIREDRDATDWNETELTGNIAKNFDDHKDVNDFHIQSDGYVKVDVTDAIKNYINSTDQDNKMTFRIYTNSGDWFVIKSSESDTPPIVDLVYKPVEVAN